MELCESDPDDLKEKFTPRAKPTITPAMESLARSMYNSGFTYAQISERLGISSTTATKLIEGKEAK